MKKTMFLALTVLGMVLGSIAVVQPAKAAGNCTETIGDGYGCSIRICEECIITFCSGGNIPACGPTIT